MPNKELIVSKLAEIYKQLNFLKEIVQLNETELFGNAHNLYFSERVLERLIVSAIDINMHLLADLTDKTAVKYSDSFVELVVLGVYDKQFGSKIAKSVTLRNLLAHEYMNIDQSKYFESLPIALADFTLYAEYIDRFCEEHAKKSINHS